MAATGTSTSRESTELANASTPRSTKPSNKRTASDANTNTPVKSARRKHDGTSAAPSRPTDVVDLTEEHVAITTTTPAKKPKTPRKRKDPDEPVPERRARVFRNHPPKTYLDRLARARSQRMFVVGHSVTTNDNFLEMKFDMVGTTGNIYKTTIGKIPECDCPDARKGHQCKHICYVLAIVLKAPENLQYQLAFLSTELQSIYQNSALSRQQTKTDDTNNDGKRKPIEGDCPICFMGFEPATEEIVWCQAACGNNIHKTCFDQWAATQRSQGVRCVYCRSPWQADTSNLNVENLAKEGRVNYEGYLNVANQLGLSGQRDYSTYHPFWVDRQLGRRRYYYYD